MAKVGTAAWRETLRDGGPVIRRYFINTLFDSTFTLLGIVVGISFVSGARVELVLLTMLTASLALGISTGVSVYEAETLERERSQTQLENAMLSDLSGTHIEHSSRKIIFLATAINFSTPLMAVALTAFPFVLVYMGVISLSTASIGAVLVALGVLFAAGVYLGKMGKQNPWLKGLRMVGFGILAFMIGFALEYLLF